ncbi:MAG: hypothetical protein EP341_00335 [Sphingomonadales bacterium]|nr:MAG: hypothetical protein EP341_00335 [Sphingomonadales bacterium]
MASAHRNTLWQARVRDLLRQGWGVEDMVNRWGFDETDLRREIEILRESGELEKLYEVRG